MPRSEPGSTPDLSEIILGYGLILFVIWMPEFPQRILSPVGLIFALAVVLARRPRLDELGLGRRGLASSSWLLPAALVLAMISILIAQQLGPLHPLDKRDLKHVAGYLQWPLYRRFLVSRSFV